MKLEVQKDSIIFKEDYNLYAKWKCINKFTYLKEKWICDNKKKFAQCNEYMSTE